MARTTSDSTKTEPPSGPELVTVSHPTLGTDEVPLDAALALEAQKTGWVRDDKAKIAALQAEVEQLLAKSDIDPEVLREATEGAAAHAASLEARISDLEDQVAERDASNATLTAEKEALEARISDLEDASKGGRKPATTDTKPKEG